jgi:hypothetical protein
MLNGLGTIMEKLIKKEGEEKAHNNRYSPMPAGRMLKAKIAGSSDSVA